MADGPKITLLIDIVSPFAYLSHYVLKNSPVFQKCEIILKPVLLGGIMKATDNRPPILVKNKAIWINLDRQRWAQRFDIPVRKEAPSGFPANTLQTQRALCALELLSPQHLPAAIDALYNAYWVTEGDTDINSPAAIHSILKPVLGDELAGKVMARIGDADVKKRLLENTEWAVEKGAFGLPWYICTNGKGKEEVYWGFDHLKMIADSLGLEGELKSML